MNDRNKLESTSCKNPTLASEIIAEQTIEIEKLKEELRRARSNAKGFEDDWEYCAQQRLIFMLQTDIIKFVLEIFDYKCLKMALSYVKAVYGQQSPEEEEQEGKSNEKM